MYSTLVFNKAIVGNASLYITLQIQAVIKHEPHNINPLSL